MLVETGLGRLKLGIRSICVTDTKKRKGQRSTGIIIRSRRTCYGVPQKTLNSHFLVPS